MRYTGRAGGWVAEWFKAAVLKTASPQGLVGSNPTPSAISVPEWTCNGRQAARARHDMRTWQVERRKRTRHLIELGGLVVKAGIVDLTGDDRAMMYGALLWMADELQSDQGEHAGSLWTAKGKQALEAAWKGRIPIVLPEQNDQA